MKYRVWAMLLFGLLSLWSLPAWSQVTPEQAVNEDLETTALAFGVFFNSAEDVLAAVQKTLPDLGLTLVKTDKAKDGVYLLTVEKAAGSPVTEDVCQLVIRALELKLSELHFITRNLADAGESPEWAETYVKNLFLLLP